MEMSEREFWQRMMIATVQSSFSETFFTMQDADRAAAKAVEIMRQRFGVEGEEE